MPEFEDEYVTIDRGRAKENIVESYILKKYPGKDIEFV